MYSTFSGIYNFFLCTSSYFISFLGTKTQLFKVNAFLLLTIQPLINNKIYYSLCLYMHAREFAHVQNNNSYFANIIIVNVYFNNIQMTMIIENIVK